LNEAMRPTPFSPSARRRNRFVLTARSLRLESVASSSHLPVMSSSVTTCPPGAEASKVTWVGTCRNPKDGRDYLVSYNDCCGKVACGRCLCNFNERERPAYRMGVHNDINWCMADKQTMYHCTVSVIVGVANA
jgi:amicyanin-dependent methylamine dehydrogenase small subunit